MCYVRWICMLMFITKVCCQCKGEIKILSVGYSAASVNSPNYDNGYSTDTACLWRQTTSITGSSLLIQLNKTIDCTGDDLTIYDGTDTTGLILHSCTTLTHSYIVSMTGSIYISFTTDNISRTSEKGFAYNVIAATDLSGTSCSSIMTLTASTTVQYISSPNFPGEYPKNSDCTWRIERLGDSKSMELSFKFIDIEWEKDGPCSYDNVKIKDDDTGTTVLTTCGDNEWFPTQTYSTSGNITVQFKSDATKHQRGFLLAYSVHSSSTTAPADNDSCFLDNCAILPVLIAIGGVVLIAIIGATILCIASKAYVLPKNVTVSPSETNIRKKPSPRRIIFPRFGGHELASFSMKDIFGPMDQDSIISLPPIATEGIRDMPPKYHRKTNITTCKNISKLPRPVVATTLDEQNTRPVVATTVDKQSTRPVVATTVNKQNARPVVATTVDKQNTRPVVATTVDKQNTRPVVATTVNKQNARPVVATTVDKQNTRPVVASTVAKLNTRPVVATTVDENNAKPSLSPKKEEEEKWKIPGKNGVKTMKSSSLAAVK